MRSQKKSKHKSQKYIYLYALYIGIDSGKLSFSMIKYGFDVYFKSSELALNEMQAWMHTPVGAAGTVLAAATLVSFSLLANYLDKHDNRFLNQFIITSWPYIRDCLKSLRNSLRGVTSTLTLLFLLGLKDLRYLVVPAGLGLGIVSMLNRIYLRYKMDRQKEILKANKQLLAEIQNYAELTPEQIETFHSRIVTQSNRSKILSFISSLLSGLIDGINPYIGSLALGILAPPTLIFITTFCVIYFCAVLTIRIYDEINFQRKLKESEKKITLTLLKKEINWIKNKLVELESNGLVDAENINESLSLSSALDTKRWEKKQAKFSQPRTNFFTLLNGLKNGLNIYKYIMLTISLCLFLSPIKIDPVAPVKRAIIGLLALLGSITYSLSSLLEKWLLPENQIRKCFSDLDKTKNNCDLTPWKNKNLHLKNPNLFFSSPRERAENTRRLDEGLLFRNSYPMSNALS